MNAILKKELRVAFGGLFGYATVALLLLFSGAFFALFNLLSGYPEFSYTLVAMHLVLVFVIPFLTMRSLAEERHDRTDFLLYSLPIRLHEVVLGKFFAMLTLFLIPTAVSALYPLLLSFLGEVSLISAYASLVGYILLGGALISVCMYLSSLVESQILAAILSLAAMLALYFADRFAALTGWERHRETHECFILLSGQGSMLIRSEDGQIEKTEMVKNVIYDVLPGEWHHIIVSPDATVLIVENADTSSQNTDKCPAEGGDC